MIVNFVNSEIGKGINVRFIELVAQLAKEKNIDFDINKDLFFSEKEFNEAIKKARPNSILVFDESCRWLK